MPDTEALKQLRRVAAAIPPTRLDMGTFCRRDASCGTVMCLAGWAAVDPWHRVNTRINERFYATEDGMIEIDGEGPLDLFLADIYDIEADEAARLFALNIGISVARDATKACVLQRIDQLLAGEQIRSYS